MSINSVGSSLQSQIVQSALQTTQVSKAGGDNDGDSDGSSAKAAQGPATPTVNLSGQKIGQIISTSA